MNVLHFDCFSGISGDMVLGALVDVGVPQEVLSQAVDSLGINVKLNFEKIRKNGFAATYATVEAPNEHGHRSLHQIEKIVEVSNLSSDVKTVALKIFRRLANAEAKAHGISVDKVHFHEVGAADSIADIVGAAVGFCWLKIDKFTSRSIPTGHGTIKCEHGIMPVPTPGTTALLEGAPVASVNIAKELTTPTGAAILTSLVSSWMESPLMTIQKVGCGAGSMDLPSQPNILRMFLGKSSGNNNSDSVWVLETNLDDISAEHVAFCTESLLQAGALDAYSIPITMKKGRLGLILSVICNEELIDPLQMIIFRETATMGIRKHRTERVKLQRESIIVETKYGPLAAKKGWLENKVNIITPEYEDCARIARAFNIPLREIYSEFISNASEYMF